jgi:formylglycine-generating enzyme required for sulfatase activity
MDATEVTVEAYDRCLRAGRCEAEERPEREDPEDDEARCNAGHPDRADHPMNCVTWSQAERYCRANGKRLPTEQEWELAARGAAGRMFPWGEAWEPDRLCWNRKDGTCPAGAYRAGDTALGLTDMAGNVWEWTSSRYCPYDEAECSDAGYVDRGGGWISEDPRLLHSAHRGRGEPETWASYLGFRCVKGR